MASDFPVSQCSGIYGATFERVAVTTSLSSPQSANSSTTCSQAGSSSIHTLERGELMCPKEKFDLLDWMKFVFLDDADEVGSQPIRLTAVLLTANRLLGGDPEVCVLVLTGRDNLTPGPEPTHRRGYENRTEN